MSEKDPQAQSVSEQVDRFCANPKFKEYFFQLLVEKICNIRYPEAEESLAHVITSAVKGQPRDEKLVTTFALTQEFFENLKQFNGYESLKKHCEIHLSAFPTDAEIQKMIDTALDWLLDSAGESNPTKQ